MFKAQPLMTTLSVALGATDWPATGNVMTTATGRQPAIRIHTLGLMAFSFVRALRAPLHIARVAKCRGPISGNTRNRRTSVRSVADRHVVCRHGHASAAFRAAVTAANRGSAASGI
jgi:hypothetical protein